MHKTAYIVVLIALFSCKSQKNGSEGQLSELEREHPVSLIVSDLYGGTEVPEIQVIRKEADLKAFYTKLNRTRKPGLPVPDIDFEKEMVVIYCTGKTTNPLVPELIPVERTDEQLVLAEKSDKKYLKDSENSAKLLPFGLYKMPITEKEIVLNSLKR